MKAPLTLSVIASAITFAAVFFTTAASAENVVEVASSTPAAPVSAAAAAAPTTPPATTSAIDIPTTIYRQVMPDGRIVYSDKAVKNSKIDHTITVPPPIKGNLWTSEPGTRPHIPQKAVPTQIIKAPPLSLAEKKKIAELAESSVIRAEMLLEDAKRKQENGVEPLPGERTGNADGKSRLNETYEARQKLLAKGVANAEAALKKAQADQIALR